MAVKKIEELNIHRDVNSTEQFDVQGYLNENWDKMQDVIDNNAEELMQVQKDINTLKEDNKTNKSSIDVLEKSNETRDGKISKNAEDIEAIQGSIKAATETINKKDNEQDEDIKANKESIKEIQAENERLREDIKSIAVVNEVSGENIHIEDSSDARCEIEIGGNHQQETREGYNQFKITSTSTQSAGITITKIDESSVSYQGTTTGMFTHMLVEYDGNGLEITKQMYLKAFGNLTNAILSVKLIKNGKTESSYLRVSPDLILSAGDVLQQIYVQQQNTGILISETLQVLLTDYENKDKPYEQYGASPSIDFPSELKAVGDDINILNDTIFARKGYYNGTAGATIKKVNSTTRLLTDEDISVISNKDIAISLGTDKALMYNVFEIDENDVIIKNNMSSNNKDKTIKLQVNTKKISLMLMWQDTTKTITLEDIKDCKIKIAYGTSIRNYSSYNHGSAKVKFQNRNISPILNLGTNWEYTDKGIKNNTNSNGKELFSFKIKKGQKVNIGLNLISKPSGDTTFTIYVDESSNIISAFGHIENYKLNQIYQREYTATKDCKITCRMFGNENKDIFEFQMWAEYDNLTKYQRYEEQSYLVDVQQEMLEGDTFVRQDGKWYEKHCWKKMLLNGTEKAGVSGASTNEILAIVYDINNAVDGFGYSNYFLYSSQIELNKMNVYNGGKNLRVNVSKMQFTDLESFKAKLKELYEAGTPVIIYYKLAEPILLECTETQSKVLDEIYNKAHTYKNITNISAESSEVNPIVSLKYLKDAETEHNKLQAQIDEIKQLLSSTETSAMLLNNMQTDLESEV